MTFSQLGTEIRTRLGYFLTEIPSSSNRSILDSETELPLGLVTVAEQPSRSTWILWHELLLNPEARIPMELMMLPSSGLFIGP